jgi:5'-3' exonuclease
MERMNDYLHANESDVRERIGAQTLIISGPDEDGEGEQKIFSFLRRNPSQHQGSVDLVYGMDADLILQSLLWHSDSHIGGLWVVREENSDEDVSQAGGHVQFIYIDIRRLLSGIERKFHCTADDFALLCVFIGNDFVPRLPSVSVQGGGIDALMQARRQVLESSNALEIVDAKSKVIDMRLLTRIVEVLAQAEGEALQVAEARHQDMQRKMTQLQRHRPANIIDDLPLMHPFPNGTIEPSRPGWRPRYHRHVMHLDVTHGGGGSEEDTSELSVACKSYLQGVVWSYRYTAQICLSKSWYYPFSAAPTATDLHNFMLCHPEARDVEDRLAKLDCEENNRDLVITDPILQLLAVLPPQSAHLLPDHARALVTTLRHGLMHMYPVKFEFCKYLKYKTWECHPILPRVDVVALKRQLMSSQ